MSAGSRASDGSAQVTGFFFLRWSMAQFDAIRYSQVVKRYCGSKLASDR